MENKVSIYLVDDQGAPLVRIFEQFLGERFLFSWENNIEAEKVISYLKGHQEVHVVLLDIYQDGEPRGIQVLKKIRAVFGEEIQVIMISERTDVENVVAAVQGGAQDYVGRGVYENLDDENVRSLFIRKLLGAWEKAKGKRAYRMSEEAGLVQYGDMIGNSSRMVDLHTKMERCASVDSIIVLLTGETGTGKEMAANRLHSLSKRKDLPFIPCNLGAIPRTGNFLQATLFGIAKNGIREGDPKKDRPGVFEQAKGGTVFLDEIGLADSETQFALLRTLQEKEIVPLGDVRPRKVRFSAICGTNADLVVAIEKGEFREDLYYRINDVEIELPPLRDRGEDVVQLSFHFLNKFNREFDRKFEIRNEDVGRIMKQAWPGNVRELEHMIKRSVVLTDPRLQYLELHFDKRSKGEKE